MPDYRITVTTVAKLPEAQEVTIERLIRAKNEARAIAHIVKDTITVERASVDDVVRLTKAGVDIEVVSKLP